MAVYDEEADLDGVAESFKDQCEKENFEDQEERSLTDQEWEDMKELQKEEQFLKEQEKNMFEMGID